VDYLPKERLQSELVARSLRAALRFHQAQREKQEAINEMRARDRAIAAATNGIVLADPRRPDCPIVYANAAFLGMTGYTEGETLGRNCRFLQGPGTDPGTVRDLHEAIQAARPHQTSILNYRKDGTSFWNELTVSPVRDAQGNLTHFVGIQTDVTARHEADRERRRTEDALRRFQFLSDNANDALFLLDEAGHFLYVNGAACHSLGYRAEEFRRMRPVDIDPLHDDAAYRALFLRLDGERLPPFESLHRRKDGTTFPIEASVSRLDIGDQPLLFSSCRDISTRKAAERALQEANQRTASILESITDAFFALDADWRFTYVNTQAERLLARTQGELLGRRVWDEFPESVGSTFEREYRRAAEQGVAVSFEEYFPPLDTWFEVRAYPAADGLSIFFQNVNERRALEAERAQIAAREHRIAEQLQEALLPAIPPRVPGLRLGSHYRAALQEAGIGGDFAQVFSDDKGISHLVVGDLAGKGLAAAGQIATVTNMLRFAVLNGRTLAGPVTSLNATLADGGLLSGFATLFVGRYDAGSRVLTYVNCGQDAGLILRAASGEVEALPPTGPVLGAVSGAVYAEGEVTLETGDLLALFTDGLTEAGPSRARLLTGEGVAGLLRGLAGVTDPQVAVESLIAGVDAYAGREPQDDQCLLVALASKPEAGRP
jgi:PAS domain S-box-containing protein